MPNHYHLLIRQNTDLPISKLVLRVCGSYSIYFNRKYDRVGSLFQDQYKAVLVDSDAYLLWLSAYIHNNPKTAGLAEKLESWQWSSYPEYIGVRQGGLCDTETVLKISGSPNTYAKFTQDASEKIGEKKDFEYLFLDRRRVGGVSPALIRNSRYTNMYCAEKMLI